MASFVSDGQTHTMDQMYAEPHLVVARMTGTGWQYRIGMHGQKQFEHRPHVRNIKLSEGGGRCE